MSYRVQCASASTVFQFQASHEIRVFTLGGGAWFVAADVCAALDLPSTAKALSRLDDSEKSQVVDPSAPRTIQGNGADNLLDIINEPGLYSLAATSRKPRAKQFKEWMASEVIPAIRKAGCHAHRSAQPRPAPLGDIALWVVSSYTRCLGQYHSYSTQQISARIHPHLRVHFGVHNIRDIPIDRLEDLLTLLENIHEQAYRLCSVCLELETALLQSLHSTVNEDRYELPAAIRQAMASVDGPDTGEGSISAFIRDKAFQRLAALNPCPQ